MPAKQRDEDKDQNVNANIATASPEVQAAEKAGLSEGELKALRDDSGLNRLPGNEANNLAWEASEEGQKFIKEAKDRDKEAEEGAKAAHKDLDKDGLSEAEKKYREVVSK